LCPTNTVPFHPSPDSTELLSILRAESIRRRIAWVDGAEPVDRHVHAYVDLRKRVAGTAAYDSGTAKNEAETVH
jgi:hypothetical protein